MSKKLFDAEANMKRTTKLPNVTRFFFSGALLVLLAMSAPITDAFAQSDKIPGMSLGAFKVNNNGAANYTIPIIVPPGTNGIAPKLSFLYDSQRQNGLLGMGWALEGLPIIQRCRANMAQDGFVGGIQFNSSDRYCLDGARLIAISGIDGGNGTEYRTELDVFVRVFSYSQSNPANSGPLYWVVKNKAGETLEFGGNATDTSGRIEAQGKITNPAPVRVWALSKITDVNGNYLTITYDEDATDQANGDYRPHEIKYTGNGQNPTQRSILFVYEDRPDKTPMYVGGSLVKMLKRLNKIQTFAPSTSSSGAVLVREYRLAYGLSTDTSIIRSRLTSITECDVAGVCLSPHSFTYQDSIRLFDSPAAGFPTHWNNSNVWSGDFNGDGKLDLVSINNNNFVFALSNGDGSFYTPPEVQVPTGWNTSTVWVGDFNGDGISDLASNAGGRFQFAVFGYANGQIFLKNPNQTRIDQFSGWDTAKTWVGDWNGDGISDLASTNNSSFYFAVFGYSNNQVILKNPTQQPVTRPAGWDATKTFVGDFNGDGIKDLVSSSNGKFRFALLSYSFSTNVVTLPNTALTADFPANWSNTSVAVGDFNGDGKTDIISYQSKLQVVFSRGDGTIDVGPKFDVGTWNDLSVSFADINGDGKTDVTACFSNSFSSQYSAGDGTFLAGGGPIPANWNCWSDADR
jgi:FG-GAP-like repeat/Salmonella virulence plasmid 65kDa B protein